MLYSFRRGLGDSSVAQSVLGDRASGRLEREVGRLDSSDCIECRDLAARLSKLAGDADAQAMSEAVLAAPQFVDGVLHGASADPQRRVGRRLAHW